MHCFSTKIVDPDHEELASLLSTCAFQLVCPCQFFNAAGGQGPESQNFPISHHLLQVGMQQPLQTSLELQELGQSWWQSSSLIQMMKVLMSDSLTAFL